MSKFSILLLSSVFCAFPVNAQTLQITVDLQTLSGFPDGGHGSGFVVDSGLVVTSSHVIPAIYPSLKKGVIKANGVPMELVCYDNVMDLALLRPDVPIPSIHALQLHDNVKIGMEYVANYSSDRGVFAPVPHSSLAYEMPLSLVAKGTILDIVSIRIREADNTIRETDVKFIVTGNDSAKTGFSGGPVISNGKVIGIVTAGEAGSYGILSHVDNLKKLLQRKDCQK